MAFFVPSEAGLILFHGKFSVFAGPNPGESASAGPASMKESTLNETAAR
jgi:hypothetical protein